MKRAPLLVLVLAALAAAIYMIFFRLSDEDRIRRRLDQVAYAVHIGPGEKSPISRAARIQKHFTEIFTQDATAIIEELDEGLEGRDALIAAAVQLGGAYTSATVSFDKVTVRINGPAAELRAIATVTGARQGASLRYEAMRVKLALRKIDGDFRVTSAVVGPGEARDMRDP